MLLVHLVSTIVGIVVLIDGPFRWPVRILLALGLQLLVPCLTVLYRVWRAHRIMNVRAVLLYWLYYWARLEAAVRVLAGNDNYHK
jgi:hypothetical protein